MTMPIIDFSHLSPQERLDLIGELWDSIETEHLVLTPAQEAELDRRLTTLDEDIEHGRSADAVLADLQHRHR
jgi:putative addiction module component (TIGR02574 family)